MEKKKIVEASSLTQPHAGQGEIKALLFDYGNTIGFVDYELLAEEFSRPGRRLEHLCIVAFELPPGLAVVQHEKRAPARGLRKLPDGGVHLAHVRGARRRLAEILGFRNQRFFGARRRAIETAQPLGRVADRAASGHLGERVAGGVSTCGRDPGDPERRDEYGPMHRGDCKATLHRTKIGRARNASGQ